MLNLVGSLPNSERIMIFRRQLAAARHSQD
jgi:hypothetical protein